MLHIYICDDIVEQANNIQKIISNLIVLKDWDIIIKGTFHSPSELLSAIERRSVPGLYFLDIELNAEINGLQLAQRIRDYDPDGFIVFITTHDECITSTFHYHLEALDFIIKDTDTTLTESIKQVLNSAYKKYLKRLPNRPDFFSYKSGAHLHLLKLEDIMYIEALPELHQTRVYTADTQISGFETLKSLLTRLSNSFMLCHRSYIVNLNQIAEIDIKNRQLYLKSGKTLPVSVRQLPKILQLCKSI